jgi:hypothetical protein
MKKTFFVLFAFMMILTVPAFTQATVSGEFTWGFNLSDDEFTDAWEDADITVTGTPDDAAEIVMTLDLTSALDNAMDDDDTNNNDTTVADILSEAYLKTDIMKALELDSPVGVSMLFGVTDYDGQDYLDDVAGYSPYETMLVETETSNYVAATVDVMGLVTIEYALDPDLSDDIQNMFTNVYGSFEIVDAEAYMVNLYNSDSDEVEATYGTDIVAHLGGLVNGLDALNTGAGVEYNDETEITRYGASASVEVMGFYFGVAFAGFDGSEDSDDDKMGLGLDATYALTKDFSLVAAYSMDDLEDVTEDTTGYELGASYTLTDSVTTYAGYVTEDHAYNAEADDFDGFFFVVSVEY